MCRYQVAFYKGRKEGKGIMPIIFRALDSLTRTVTKGPYSHTPTVKSSKFCPLERLNVSVLAIGMAVFVVKYYR